MTFGLAAAFVATVATAYQYKPSNWTYVEFSEKTDIGTVHVTAAVDPRAAPEKLSKLEIRVNRRSMRVPRELLGLAIDPHLDKMWIPQLDGGLCFSGTTGDAEECPPDTTAALSVPFGRWYAETESQDSCAQSQLVVSFSAKEIQSVVSFPCIDGVAKSPIELYKVNGT
jgi:hypothetical protein